MEINQDICDILKVFPDAPICKLAILCNTDCRDVGLFVFINNPFGITE